MKLIWSSILSLFFLVACLHSTVAQKDIRNFIFGHSLINHAIQVNPTPSQETSIPHWMHFLTAENDNTYAVDGQFGFLGSHQNLPPIPGI